MFTEKARTGMCCAPYTHLNRGMSRPYWSASYNQALLVIYSNVLTAELSIPIVPMAPPRG